MVKKVFVGFCAILITYQILFITLISYNDFINSQSIISNNLIKDDSINIIFRGDKIPDLEDISHLIDSCNSACFIELDKNSDLNIIGIYGKYNLPYHLQALISGTFFSDPKTNKEAVIGQNILNSKLYINSKFIQYNNIKYNIVGIISNANNKMLDNNIYIYLFPSEVKSIRKLTIVGKDKKSTDNFANQLYKLYEFDIISKEKNYIDSYFFNQEDVTLLNHFIISFIVMLIFLQILFIYFFNKKENNIKYIIGFNFFHILKDNFKFIFYPSIFCLLLITPVYLYLYFFVLLKLYIKFLLLNIIIFNFITISIIFIALSIFIYFSNKSISRNGIKFR